MDWGAVSLCGDRCQHWGLSCPLKLLGSHWRPRTQLTFAFISCFWGDGDQRNKSSSPATVSAQMGHSLPTLRKNILGPCVKIVQHISFSRSCFLSWLDLVLLCDPSSQVLHFRIWTSKSTFETQGPFPNSRAAVWIWTALLSYKTYCFAFFAPGIPFIKLNFFSYLICKRAKVTPRVTKNSWTILFLFLEILCGASERCWWYLF